jgi:hypothetical protein
VQFVDTYCIIMCTVHGARCTVHGAINNIKLYIQMVPKNVYTF